MSLARSDDDDERLERSRQQRRRVDGESEATRSGDETNALERIVDDVHVIESESECANARPDVARARDEKDIDVDLITIVDSEDDANGDGRRANGIVDGEGRTTASARTNASGAKATTRGASEDVGASEGKKPMHSFFVNFQKRKDARGERGVCERQLEFITVKAAPIDEALGPIHVGDDPRTWERPSESFDDVETNAWFHRSMAIETSPAMGEIVARGSFALMERASSSASSSAVTSTRPRAGTEMELDAYLTEVATMVVRADAEASGGTSSARASETEIAQTRGELRRTLNALQARGGEHVSAQWVDRFRPLAGADVCGSNNAASVASMRRWLKAWNARIDLQSRGKPLPEPSRPCMPRKVLDEDDDEYWESDDDDDDGLGGGPSVANGVLISGPAGCGKTAAIYALANEFGFKIIEANALEKRNGADIVSRFMEATQSKRFSKKATAAKENERIKAKDDVEKEAKAPTKPAGLKAFFGVAPVVKKSDVVVVSDPQAQALPPERAPPEETHSVILFEEIDVKLGSERGFMAALSQLCETTKRPVIFTSNASVLPELSMNLPLARLRFEAPSVRDCATYGAVASAAAGQAIRAEDAWALALACKGDLRRTIHNAQVVALGDGAIDLDAIDIERHATLLIDSARAAIADGVGHLNTAPLGAIKALHARTRECERLEYEKMLKAVEEGLHRHELRLKQLELEKASRRRENRAKKQKILGMPVEKPELELVAETAAEEEDEAVVAARIHRALSAFALNEPSAEPESTLEAADPPSGGWERSSRELFAIAELAETLSRIDELRTGTCCGITGLCRRDAAWSKETIGDEEALEDCSPDEDFYLSNGPARQTLGGSDNVGVNASTIMTTLAGRRYATRRKALREEYPEATPLKQSAACAPSTPLQASKRARGSTRSALVTNTGEMHIVWRARALAEAAGGFAGNLSATTDRLGFVARMVRIQSAPKTATSPSSRESRRQTRNRRQHLTLASETRADLLDISNFGGGTCAGGY